MKSCRNYILAAVVFIGIVTTVNAQTLLWPNGGGFTTFGPNEAVVIDLGTIRFINTCTNGTNDFIFPFSDIYVIPLDSTIIIGSPLVDISGIPNTVQASGLGGVFVSEVIGFTKPTGSIPSGTYSVVYDECQNGRFDVEDTLFDAAFKVVIPAKVPAIDSTIREIKIMAEAKGDSLLALRGDFEQLYNLYEAWVLFKIALFNPVDRVIHLFIKSAIKNAFWFGVNLFVGISPKEAALTHLLNAASHYFGIHADPPNPNFKEPASLGAREIIDSHSVDILVKSLANLGTVVNTEEAIVLALLNSIEKYQGADIANDGEWALIHAGLIKMYAELLEDQLSNVNASLASFSNNISSDTRPFDQLAQQYILFRNRVLVSGFSDEELQIAANLDLSSSEILQLQDTLLELDFSGFSKANVLTTISQLQSSNNIFKLELAKLSSDMNLLIDALKEDPGTIDRSPIANAGSSYQTNEGALLVFDGSLSSSPSGIGLYEWDLDGDGEFDDASGPNPSFTYNSASEVLVGLRVTDGAGLSNIDYAAISVSNVNSAPVITNFSPSEGGLVLVSGTSQPFDISFSDPDGDPVTIEWNIDGSLVSTGAVFSFTPTNSDLGVRVIEALISDNNTLGGAVSTGWIVPVFLPDADGDGWNGNVDCDDSDPLVNPGMTEIVGNGKDDDCDPSTPDAIQCFDADNDGFTTCDGDCDDNNPSVFPGGIEICDGLDNNCNGQIDEGINVDADNDGFSVW